MDFNVWTVSDDAVRACEPRKQANDAARSHFQQALPEVVERGDSPTTSSISKLLLSMSFIVQRCCCMVVGKSIEQI